MRDERIEIDGIPARLYVPDGADGLLLLGHGGGYSKDAPRFVDLSKLYAGIVSAIVKYDVTCSGVAHSWDSVAMRT